MRRVLPDGRGTGYQAVVAREEEERRARLNGDLEDFLAGEPELLEVFKCLCSGITKPAEIARTARIEEGRVEVLRKRLERRIDRFRGRKAKPFRKADCRMAHPRPQ